jgi:menaquinone-specific isochorismate synthase
VERVSAPRAAVAGAGTAVGEEPLAGSSPAAATRGLRARTMALEVDVDPLVHAGEDGLVFTHPRGSMTGVGAALRIPLPADASPAEAAALVSAALAAIEVEDEVGRPGCGPVAFAALPFAPGRTRELIVPEDLVGRTADGTMWRTTVLADASEADAGGPPARGRSGDGTERHHDLPGAFSVTSTIEPQAWCAKVAAARDRLQAGDLRKVVLAREVEVTTGGRISRRAVLERLRDAYPGCMLFAVDGFVGASPELLVAVAGDQVRSHPLAGTTKRSADPDEDRRLSDALRASAKDREEHRITIDMVHETLLPFCSYLDEEAEPSIVPMANVQHLGTMVEGQLSSPPPTALELALTLHPTPAIGGWPVAEALAMIDELEGIDRGHYAGPVGWVDAQGNGEWAVGIRSAELSDDGHRARVFAGVGVVADSDPELELAETRAKFQAMLSAIIRP